MAGRRAFARSGVGGAGRLHRRHGLGDAARDRRHHARLHSGPQRRPVEPSGSHVRRRLRAAVAVSGTPAGIAGQPRPLSDAPWADAPGFSGRRPRLLRVDVPPVRSPAPRAGRHGPVSAASAPVRAFFLQFQGRPFSQPVHAGPAADPLGRPPRLRRGLSAVRPGGRGADQSAADGHPVVRGRAGPAGGRRRLRRAGRPARDSADERRVRSGQRADDLRLVSLSLGRSHKTFRGNRCPRRPAAGRYAPAVPRPSHPEFRAPAGVRARLVCRHHAAARAGARSPGQRGGAAPPMAASGRRPLRPVTFHVAAAGLFRPARAGGHAAQSRYLQRLAASVFYLRALLPAGGGRPVRAGRRPAPSRAAARGGGG